MDWYFFSGIAHLKIIFNSYNCAYLKSTHKVERTIYNLIIQMEDRTCSNCGKEFNFPSQLERHHNGPRKCKAKPIEHKCNKCDNCFTTKYSLIRHYKICKVNHETNDTINEQNISTKEPANEVCIKPTNTITDIMNLLNTMAANQKDKEKIQSYWIPMLLDTLQKIINYENKIICNNIPNINSENISNTTDIITNNSQIIPPSVNNTNTTNNNTNNTTNNTTTNNTLVQNANTTNYNLNVLPDVVFPFGYESLDFLSKQDMLEILKNENSPMLALRKVHSRPENRNFHRQNAKNDMISSLEKDMTYQIYSTLDFQNKLARHGIILIKRMFHECYPYLDFYAAHALLTQINEFEKMKYNNFNIKEILHFMEERFQNPLGKEIFKKFSYILNNDDIRADKIEIITRLVKELEEFNKDLATSDITDESLQDEYWDCKMNYADDADPELPSNDLTLHYYKDTPRYKYIKKMQEEEENYFNIYGISIGNLAKYHKILKERIEKELKIIEDKYFEIRDNIQIYKQNTIDAFNEIKHEVLNTVPEVELNPCLLAGVIEAEESLHTEKQIEPMPMPSLEPIIKPIGDATLDNILDTIIHEPESSEKGIPVDKSKFRKRKPIITHTQSLAEHASLSIAESLDSRVQDFSVCEVEEDIDNYSHVSMQQVPDNTLPQITIPNKFTGKNEYKESLTINKPAKK